MKISSLEPVLSNLTLNFTLFCVVDPSYSGYISLTLSIAVASNSLLGDATSKFTDICSAGSMPSLGENSVRTL